MQIWCIKTDWASYEETGSDVTLYAAKESAQADFEKEVSEELDRYGIIDDNFPDGYTMEKQRITSRSIRTASIFWITARFHWSFFR